MLMLWIILCLIAAALWSLGVFFDNYQTDVIFRNKLPQAMKRINGPFYLIIAVVIAIVCRIQLPALDQIGFLLLSGIVNSVATLFYYAALKNEEATGATIFYQLQPIMFLILEFVLFGESISPMQIIGLVLILAAPVTVVFSRKRASARRTEMRAAILLIIYVLMATISGEIAIRMGRGLDFIPVFVFYLIGRGTSDTIISFLPSLRRRHKYVMAHNKKIYLSCTLINQCICTIAEFMYRYGLIIGVAALGSAITNATELILTFIFGIILSIIWPKFGREKLRRREVIAHILAVILCAIGIFVIQ